MGAKTTSDMADRPRGLHYVYTVFFTSFIGYITHEAVVWSDVHDCWFFLPRRCSKESYNDVLDEARGCNVMITADGTFTDIKVCYCLHISESVQVKIQ